MTTMSIDEIEAHNRICAAEDILDVPLVECRPWCETGDGHPHEIFRDNQICCSPELRIEMSLEPPVPLAVRRGNQTAPDRLDVYAEQKPGGGCE